MICIVKPRRRRPRRSMRLVDLYLKRYVPERLATSPATTHQENERTIRFLGDFLKRPATTRDLKKDTIIAYLNARLKAKKRRGTGAISAETVDKERRVLVFLSRFSYDEFGTKLGTPPPRKIPKLKGLRQQPEAYRLEDITRLLAAAAEETELLLGIPAGLWWTSLLASYYCTGYRRRALLASRWDDLDRDRGILRCRPENQKQRVAQAQPLHPAVLILLDRIRQPDRELIWPWPYRSHGPWYRRQRRIILRAGLSFVPRKPTHALRAAHATYLAGAAGLAAAAESCGHSSSRVTLTSYIDPAIASERRAGLLPPPAMPSTDRQWRLFD